MIHFAVFGYLFVFIAGVVCLTIALFLYFKIRSKLLFHFLVYFSAFTLFVFFYLLVLTYINANYAQVDFYIVIAVLAVIIVSYSFFLYSILHFGHYLVNKKPTLKRSIFELSISVISHIGIISSFSIDWVNNQINQQFSAGLILSFVLFFFAVIYVLVLKLSNIKNIDAELKQIYMRTSILNIVFIPGFLLDFYLIKTLHFSLFIPLFYICYSILFLQYFIKTYSADLTADRSPEDIKELDNHLNLAGISTREKEIITLIMKGHSNQKIGSQLFISLSTVKTHVRNIFQKLNVESRFEILTKLKNTQLN